MQAVVLCGGLGTRLGDLTSALPKPLLSVGGQPFLARLLFELRRHGIRRVLLLASFISEAIENFVATREGALLDLDIRVAIEPQGAGTGGALWHARTILDETFLFFNGDSWFDINLLDMTNRAASNPDAIGCLALRWVSDASRYGVVSLDGERVTAFASPAPSETPALVNGGVYVLRREIIDVLQASCSLEHDIFPRLAADGRLTGIAYDGFFIDIGIPTSFSEAQTVVPSHQRRPAIFLDRDGVLNEDFGHVGTKERFVWRPGAIEMVKLFNDAGYFVFVVTNQAGVAKGFYDETAVNALHSFMSKDLAKHGAHVDDIRYCPFHEDGTIAAYAMKSSWRKPEPGMVLDLLKHWPVDQARSILIGDKESDILAAQRAGIRGHRVDQHTRLDSLAVRLIAAERDDAISFTAENS